MCILNREEKELSISFGNRIQTVVRANLTILKTSLSVGFKNAFIPVLMMLLMYIVTICLYHYMAM